MRERVRHHPALTLLLQIIVADGGSGVERFLKITDFEPVMALLRVVGPDTGEAVGLQLLANQQATVAFHARAALACGLYLLRYPEQGLYVMADLVRDDISLGEVAGGGEARSHLIEELKVEVHLPVTWAVERANR